jgi:hypothetical protein
MFFKRKKEEKEQDLTKDYDKALGIAIETLKLISRSPTVSKSQTRAWADQALEKIAEVR